MRNELYRNTSRYGQRTGIRNIHTITGKLRRIITKKKLNLSYISFSSICLSHLYILLFCFQVITQKHPNSKQDSETQFRKNNANYRLQRRKSKLDFYNMSLCNCATKLDICSMPVYNYLTKK
jgi:hypothetical protein